MQQAGDARGAPAPVRVIRIRTDDWPARDRVEMFRELHGGNKIRLEPDRDEPLRIDATLVKFPELSVVRGQRSALRSEFSDGGDRLMFAVGSPAIATQFGRDVLLERGDAVALSGSDRGTFTTLQTGLLATLEFPRGALLPLLKDPRRSCARRIPRESPALRLLRAYVRAANAGEWTRAPGMAALAIAHVYDLAAMAVGATRHAAEIANGRGVSSARLQAIKDDILSRIHSDVSLADLAARHHVSPRYIRMLFESEETSVTEFVREERLRRARSMLVSPRFAARRIAEIAFDAGFRDLSYFNRCFRRRFGQSPSEWREARKEHLRSTS